MLSVPTSKGSVVFVLDPDVEKRVKIETGVRRKILERLYEEPLTVSQLAREFNVSHTAIAHHLLRMLEEGEVEIAEDIVGRNLPQEKYYRAIARRVLVIAPTKELQSGMDCFMNNLSNLILMGLFKLKETYAEDLPETENVRDMVATLNGVLFYSALGIASAMPYFLEFYSKAPKEDMEKFEMIADEFFGNLLKKEKPVRKMVEKLHEMGLKTIDEVDERVREYYLT